MRNKEFRLRQRERYRDKTKKIVRNSFIKKDDFKNNLGNASQIYNSYEECVDDFARHHEKNRKRCSCEMCRNQRRSNLTSSEKEKLTLQERRALEEEKVEMEELVELENLS